MPPKTYRLGKRPPKLDRRTLRLSTYVRPALLVAPPAQIDHQSQLPADLGMMGNDRYGDCGIAAAGHMVQEWTAYGAGVMHTISDADIINAYFALSPNDQGIYLLDGLNYWRHTGIGGDQIEAYAATQPASVIQAKLAIQLFGSTYIGLSLPDEGTFGPWDRTYGPPNLYNGHAVCLIAYDDATQLFTAVSWGEKMPMSYAFYEKYNDEGYAVLNDIELTAAGVSPEGFDFARLESDLARLGEPVTPVEPEPEPEPPVPVPGTGCALGVATIVLGVAATLWTILA